MSRPSTIRYWKTRKVYYCQISGHRHYLGPIKKAAEKEFHKLMAAPPNRALVGSVAELIDKFLDNVQKNLSEDTYIWYQCRSVIGQTA